MEYVEGAGPFVADERPEVVIQRALEFFAKPYAVPYELRGPDSSAAARARRRAITSAIAATPSASVRIVANHLKSPRAYSLTGRLSESTSGETRWSSPSTSRSSAATRAARRKESSQHVTLTAAVAVMCHMRTAQRDAGRVLHEESPWAD